jgi:hypothetical protein
MKQANLIALVLALTTFNCMAQSGPKTDLEAATRACKQDQEAAIGAVGLRDKGKTKEALAKILPPRGPDNNRLAKLMYEVLEDVYGYPEIKQFPYYVFRSEMCFRSVQGLPNPSSFTVVSKDVLECQAKHSEAVSDELINCIRGAVIKGTGK